MPKKMNILGIVVARSGSKGIKNKNLRKINGRPLVHYPFSALKNCPHVTKKICSTDSKTILKLAKDYNIEAPLLRPASLSSDKSQIKDVIKHSLECIDEAFSHVLLLQPTSPTVTTKDILMAINKIKKTKADTLITGYKEDKPHPDYFFKFSKHDDNIDWLLRDKNSTNRQDFDDYFVRTGLLYLFKVENLSKYDSIYGSRTTAIILPKSKSISIDSISDLRTARRYFKKHK